VNKSEWLRDDDIVEDDESSGGKDEEDEKDKVSDAESECSDNEWEEDKEKL